MGKCYAIYIVHTFPNVFSYLYCVLGVLFNTFYQWCACYMQVHSRGRNHLLHKIWQMWAKREQRGWDMSTYLSVLNMELSHFPAAELLNQRCRGVNVVRWKLSLLKSSSGRIMKDDFPRQAAPSDSNGNVICDMTIPSFLLLYFSSSISNLLPWLLVISFLWCTATPCWWQGLHSRNYLGMVC